MAQHQAHIQNQAQIESELGSGIKKQILKMVYSCIFLCHRSLGITLSHFALLIACRTPKAYVQIFLDLFEPSFQFCSALCTYEHEDAIRQFQITPRIAQSVACQREPQLRKPLIIRVHFNFGIRRWRGNYSTPMLSDSFLHIFKPDTRAEFQAI